MISTLMHKADFERVLSAPPWSRSAHFVLHHVTEPTLVAGGAGSSSQPLGSGALPDSLSTDDALPTNEPVDNMQPHLRIGAVLPKRHARRAVTRNLLRRQIRAAFERHQDRLSAGLWLVRLRQPFDLPARRQTTRKRVAAAAASDAKPALTSAAQAPLWRSASSNHLKADARAELDRLLTSPRSSSASARAGPRDRPNAERPRARR